MKRTVLLAVAVIFVFGLVFSVAQEAYAKEYKIGYVDPRVFDEYKRTQEARKVLSDKAKAKEAEMKKMVDELRKLREDQALLSDKAKSDKQAVIEEKRRALQAFELKTRDELIKDQNDMLGGIMKEVLKVIEDYSKEAGYDIVINSRAIFYGSEKDDLTVEVLKRLNK